MKEEIMNLGVVVVFVEIIIDTFFSTLNLFIPINIYYLIYENKIFANISSSNRCN